MSNLVLKDKSSESDFGMAYLVCFVLQECFGYEKPR